MWSITPDEAIEMYTRFVFARYRDGAFDVATERASLLLKKGDLSGSDVWSQVAAKIRIHQKQTPELAS